MRRNALNGISLLLGFLSLWLLTSMPALSEQAQDSFFFPQEDFTPIHATLPNARLDFDDDSQESCCAKDYTPTGQPVSPALQSGASTGQVANGSSGVVTLLRSEFERANPRYQQNATPAYLVSCEKLAELPELAVNAPSGSGDRSNAQMLPIVSYSTNVSRRSGSNFATDPIMHATSDFHVETIGGNSQLRLQDVSSYSVCMARGNNVAMIANTENASIMAYNGSDQLYLSGNNINMFTRTGAGEDLIELYQSHPSESSNTFTAYNIYKTAISGGSDTDTLLFKATPPGTKWCHIGGYRIYGEYFYVVEFALPPTVTEGPRRQRVNIGESVEYVVIKGKKYRLGDFLVHGESVDTVARSIPIGDPLPKVAIHFDRP